jgi:hypothetical protein
LDHQVPLLKYMVMVLMILAPVLAAGDQVQEPANHDYTAEGKRAPAYLDEEWVPSTWPEKDAGTLLEKSPVALYSYLPYPNPHSHPRLFVGVGSKADFRLETKDPAGKTIDIFLFSGVAPGFYKFTAGRMLPSTTMVTVTLEWDGTERGRATVQEKVLVAVE